MKRILLGTALLSIGGSAVAKKAQTPNVVFIYADDMGKGMLSAYGQPYLKTPNIDKIVTGGVEFTNVYGGHVSSAARAMLLTGYSDCRSGHFATGSGGKFIVSDTTKIAAVEQKIDEKRVVLPADDEYLPQIFKKAGYVTGQVGKLGYAFNSTRSEMVDQGWDYYYGYLDHARCHGFFPPFLFENGEIVMIEGNTHANCAKSKQPYDIAKSEAERLDMTGKVVYSQDLFNEKIHDFIDENKDRPFFLYHPTQLPHGPISVPELHEQVKDIEGLTHGEKEYATMVILLDEAVGMIMAQIEELGLSDNTMFIFSADNGHEIYTNNSTNTTSKSISSPTGAKIDNYNLKYRSSLGGDIFDGNMGLAGLKRSNLEGGVSVPLAYYMPSKIEQSIVTDVVANYDMIATMADMLGVSYNKGKDAISYYDVLMQPTKKSLPTDRIVVVDSFEGPTVTRNDGWKLRYSPVSKDFELHNIFNDKQERRDRATEYPQIVAELRAELDKWVETTMSRQNSYVGKINKK